MFSDVLNMLRPGELVTDWMQAERLCSHLEIGDLIEFRRVVGNTKRRIYTVFSPNLSTIV